MSFRSITFLNILLLVAALVICGCEEHSARSTRASPRSSSAPESATIDIAVAQAHAFILQQQGDDGAWRSKTYGVLRDGLSLTPSCAKAIALGRVDPKSLEAATRAATYLTRIASSTRGDRELGGVYPVYTASLAILLYSLTPNLDDDQSRTARERWLSFLRSHQLDESLGWSPDDPAFGGWGYSISPLHKSDHDPQIGSPFTADLSSTLFAVGALRLAGAGDDDPAIQRALTFVMRCQNFGDDPAFDDGGFFFTPANAIQNKAGLAGSDDEGNVRYRSYGSMTADGIRALIRCGLPPDHPRVIAALQWLERHFTVAKNPGDFAAGQEYERDGAYFYYCWSLAHALRLLGIEEVNTPNGPVDWRSELARILIAKQRSDGSFANPYSMRMENDPLVATPFALAALVICGEAWEEPRKE